MMDQDLSAMESSSSSEDDADRSLRDEHNHLDARAKSMLQFLSKGGAKVNVEYKMGSTDWRSLWPATINAMSGTTGQRFRIKNGPKHFSLPTISCSKSVVRLGATSSFTLHGSSIHSDRTGVPYPDITRGNGSIDDVVGILSFEKQKYLLRVLDKMEANLEKRDVTGGIGVRKAPPPKKESDKMQYAVEQNIKYGRTPSVDDTIGTLRKIANALDTPGMKAKRAEVLGRGDVPVLLGPASLREHLASKLNLALTPRQVNLLMKKFDTEGRGSIDLRDVFGNALLVRRRRTGQKKPDSLSENTFGTRDNPPSCNRTSRSRLTHLETAEDKLATVAAQMLQGSRSSNVLRASYSTRISGIEFRHFLRGFDCGLTAEEEKKLERKFIHVPTGTVSINAFMEDFKKLGRQKVRGIEDIECVSKNPMIMQSVITSTDAISISAGDKPIELQHTVRMPLRDGSYVHIKEKLPSGTGTVEQVYDPLLSHIAVSSDVEPSPQPTARPSRSGEVERREDDEVEETESEGAIESYNQEDEHRTVAFVRGRSLSEGQSRSTSGLSL